jgi:hypothetical protein
MSDQPLQVGLSVIPLYLERRLKVYGVTENEVDSLATRNTQATTFYSVGAFVLSAALGIWINAVFYTQTPPTAEVAKYLGAPIFIVISGALFWLGWRTDRSRKSTWDAIKSESASRSGGTSASA